MLSPQKDKYNASGSKDSMGISTFFANLEERRNNEGAAPRIDFGEMTFAGALNITSLNNYKMGAYLGQGANAIVRGAVHTDSGHNVAIKIYDKFKLD